MSKNMHCWLGIKRGTETPDTLQNIMLEAVNCCDRHVFDKPESKTSRRSV